MNPLVLGSSLAVLLAASQPGIDGAPAPPSAARADPPVPLTPAEYLRRAADGADSLQLGRGAPRKNAPALLLTVSDPAAIAELVGLVETPVPRRYSGFHMCAGSPPIRLFRGKKLLTAFSFDHVSMLRPLADNLWAGDVELTSASAHAIADWFRRHGYPNFADTLAAEDAERERERLFCAALPSSVLPHLSPTCPQRDPDEPAEPSRVEVTPADPEAAGTHEPPDDAADGAPGPIEAAIRDPGERARVIFRALGLLDGSWGMISTAERVVLAAGSRLDSGVFVAAVDGCGDGSPELRGAARLLFASLPDNAPPWIERLPDDAAVRLAARAAAQVLREDSLNATGLPYWLSIIDFAALEPVLAETAARAPTLRETDSREAHPALSAFALLAARQRVPGELVEAVAARSWKSAANRAAAHVGLAAACGQLPTAEPLREADYPSKRVALRLIEQHASREAIDLAFEALLDDSRYWADASRPTAELLLELSGMKADDSQSPAERKRDLVAWWKTTRRGWASPAPGARDTTSGEATPNAKTLGNPKVCASVPKFTPQPLDDMPANARPGVPAFEARGTPKATGAADKETQRLFAAALRSAVAVDAIRLVGKSVEISQAFVKREAAGEKVLAAFEAVCERGGARWCLATDFQQGVLFERLANAVQDAPCAPEDRARDGCDHFRYTSLRREGVGGLEAAARDRYRRVLARCEAPAFAGARWCPKALDGLRRMDPWR